MKRLLIFCAILVLAGKSANGQVVSIPDAIFLNALIAAGVDSSKDGMIQVKEAEAVTFLFIDGRSIKDMTGIQSFVNLTSLYCNQNLFTSIDVGKNTRLSTLDCSQNKLTSLDVRNNLGLKHLYCNSTNISQICISTSQLSDTISWQKDSNAKWSTTCGVVTSLEEVQINEGSKVIERVYTSQGEAIHPENATNGLFIYQYSDGTTKKVMKSL